MPKGKYGKIYVSYDNLREALKLPEECTIVRVEDGIMENPRREQMLVVKMVNPNFRRLHEWERMPEYTFVLPDAFFYRPKENK